MDYDYLPLAVFLGLFLLLFGLGYTIYQSDKNYYETFKVEDCVQAGMEWIDGDCVNRQPLIR